MSPSKVGFDRSSGCRPFAGEQKDTKDVIRYRLADITMLRAVRSTPVEEDADSELVGLSFV